MVSDAVVGGTKPGAGGRAKRHRTARGALELGALGVVFGDIGTSPLYTVQTVFSPSDPHRVPVTTQNVYGVISLIFWAVVTIVMVTYVLLVMRADNDGEGGIMALITLIRRNTPSGRRTAVVLALLGIFGASLFFGDSMITPAISVLSAIEGVQVAAPSVGSIVLPITAVILIGLFMIQRLGTGAVGRLFGPVMAVWFAVIAAWGIRGIIGNPSILKALSPTYAASFLFGHFGTAFFSLAAVVLAVTGAEAPHRDNHAFLPCGSQLGADPQGDPGRRRDRQRLPGGHLRRVFRDAAGRPDRVPAAAAHRPHLGGTGRADLRPLDQLGAVRRGARARFHVPHLDRAGLRVRGGGHRHDHDQHAAVLLHRPQPVEEAVVARRPRR